MERGRVIIAAVAFAAAAACSATAEDAPAAPRGVARVDVSPDAHQLEEFQTFTVSARVLDAAGRELTGRPIIWSSSSEAVVTVTQTGVVTAVAEGNAYVRAASEGKLDSVAVTVIRAAVASVGLDAAQLSLGEGAVHQLVATVKDAAGRTLTGRGVQWASSDATVAIVGALGQVTAVRAGRSTITVRVEGKTDSAVVLVTNDYDYNLVYDGSAGAGIAPELFQIDLRQPTGMPARISPNVQAFGASPSPDGTRIAYAAYTDGRPQIYVMNVDGSGITRLTDSPTTDDQPAWSPDGTRIAFHRWDLTPNTGHADVWVMRADGSDAHSLTADQGRTNQTRPSWSPRQGDGSYRIVYSSQTNTPAGGAHIWSMRDDGTDKRQLTAGSVYDDEPAWAPDGNTIVYTRSSAAVFGDLYLVSAAGTNERRLMTVALAFGQFSPAWSPDGRLIAFASKHEGGGTYQIYTVWSDGSKLARRTFDDTDKGHPAWLWRLP